MICSAGRDPIACKCSPWKSKAWKSRVLPPHVLSDLVYPTTSLIYPKRLQSISYQIINFFYIHLILVSGCFLPFEKKSFLLQAVVLFSTYSQRSLMPRGCDPWPCFKVSTSGVKRSHLLSALAPMKWSFSSATLQVSLWTDKVSSLAQNSLCGDLPTW